MVSELKKRFEFEVEVIKKRDITLLKRLFLPKFPSLEIDRQMVFKGRDITLEELEHQILRRLQ